MVSCWEPGTQYDYGCVVEYCGAQYKIIQPHRSQGDWTPDNTPALWGRIPDGGHYGEGHHDQQYGGYGQQGQHGQYGQQGQYGGGYGYGQDEKHSSGGYQYGSGQQQPQQQQQQQHYNYGGGSAGGQPSKPQGEHGWLHEHKTELEIGGGLLAGAALLAGGVAAYHHHQKKEEEVKGGAWAEQNWRNEASARTAEFYRTGPRGPFTWVMTKGKEIPQGAIEGGRDSDKHNSPLYICRAYHEGGIHIGKAGRSLGKGAVIGWGSKEHEKDTYEILIGDSRAVRWVDSHGHLQLHSLGAQPVEGGREKDGTPLYICQAPYKGGTHPGKTSPTFNGGVIAWGGKEEIVKNYRVLVLQDPSRPY